MNDMRWGVLGALLGFLIAGSLFSEGIISPRFFAPPQYDHQDNRPNQETGSESSKENTDKRIADYTWWLVAFTAVLGLSTIGLWVATNQTARIAERALTEHERPWLFFEGGEVRFRPDSLGRRPHPNSWFIKLDWKNVGRAPALIEACEFDIIDRDLIPGTPNYSACGVLQTDKTLAAGEGCETNEVGPAAGSGMKNGQPIQFVMFGRMIYRELNGREHTTGFAIEIAPQMPVFVAHNNRAYEYYT